MKKKIELLAPAGSMEHLRAVISKGADAVYLGMGRFSARDNAANFGREQIKEAVNMCRSNNVKLYLAMNTLVKNEELDTFFEHLSYAHSKGIDGVIVQDVALIDVIKKNYDGLRVHVSTQAGVMNSAHAGLLAKADRITLARELKQEEIAKITKNCSQEIEIFGHGALCVAVSGQCLFSSLLGGRSGNRGKCAQPCRKKYNECFYLSTKELCLVEELPKIIGMGVNTIKIEGRMRTPYYAATVTAVYRKAIDSFYAGRFTVSEQMQEQLKSAFSREFTKGYFAGEDVFNRVKATGKSTPDKVEQYKVDTYNIKVERKKLLARLPKGQKKVSPKLLLVRVYNEADAVAACQNGADAVYLDLFHENFSDIKAKLDCPLFAVSPSLMFDADIPRIKEAIKRHKPDGILAGNLGILNMGLNLPLQLNYNLNCFNDLDINHFVDFMPIISPELSLRELKRFQNKHFAVLVHGKIRLMTLRHDLEEGTIEDEKGGKFFVRKIFNGSEVLNEKELGLLEKSSLLVKDDIKSFFIDTEVKVAEVTAYYRNILDGKKASDTKLKKGYVLGWSFRGVQ